MIRIFYDGETSLRISGHAGSAPKGQDLICAAVTALALTLRENAENSELSSGNASFSGGNPEVYQAMARGFSLLAKTFPKEVHFKCVLGWKYQNKCVTISAQEEKEQSKWMK